MWPQICKMTAYDCSFCAFPRIFCVSIHNIGPIFASPPSYQAICASELAHNVLGSFSRPPRPCNRWLQSTHNIPKRYEVREKKFQQRKLCIRGIVAQSDRCPQIQRRGAVCRGHRSIECRQVYSHEQASACQVCHPCSNGSI